MNGTPKPDASSQLNASDLDAKVNVLVWREVLLPASETFVRHNASTGIFDATLAGLTKTKEMPDHPAAFALLESKIARIFYRLTGRSKKIEDFICKRGFTIIHAHFGWDGVWIYRISRRLGLPLVVSLHGYDVMALAQNRSLRGLTYRYLAERTLKKVSYVLATSNFVRKRAITFFGVPEEKIITHYLGVGKAQSNSALESRSGLLFVGRLIRGKGLGDLIQAFEMLPKDIQDAGLKVIGSGPEYASLLQICEDKHLNVTFVGALSHGKVLEEMQKAKLLVMPSTTKYGDPAEGLGLVLAEAMSAGLPCIARATGGIVEVLGEGNDVQLIYGEDSMEIALKIKKLYFDSTLLQKIIGRGADRFNLMFNRENQDKRLLSIYEKLLAK
jgi:glycosyltransferase involved in cell wall biosynthesis